MASKSVIAVTSLMCTTCLSHVQQLPRLFGQCRSTCSTPCHAAGYGKVEKRVRTTGGGATGSVRNLRIREDTAKYLLNLDPNSAHYDPKSRSMREDPQPNKAKKAFAGDNFVRKSGDYHAWEAERLHQLAAYDHGATLHMQAAPSQAEILHQHFKTKKDKLQVAHCCSICVCMHATSLLKL